VQISVPGCALLCPSDACSLDPFEPRGDAMLPCTCRRTSRTNRGCGVLGCAMQLTVITHAADIADIITSAVNDHEAAAGSIFNAVSGRAVTFDGLVRLCAKAAGMEPEIVHYDPRTWAWRRQEGLPLPQHGTLPTPPLQPPAARLLCRRPRWLCSGSACLPACAARLRAYRHAPLETRLPCSWQHFYAEPRAVREKLGGPRVLRWTDILDARFEEYVSKGDMRRR